MILLDHPVFYPDLHLRLCKSPGASTACIFIQNMSTHPSVSPSHHRSIRPTAGPSLRPFDRPSARSPVRPYFRPSTRPSAHPSCRPPTHPSIHPHPRLKLNLIYNETTHAHQGCFQTCLGGGRVSNGPWSPWSPTEHRQVDTLHQIKIAW